MNAVGLVAVPTARDPWVEPLEGDSEADADGDSEADGDRDAEGLRESDALALGLSEAEGLRDGDGDSEVLVEEEGERDGDGDKLPDTEAEGESEDDGLSEALALTELDLEGLSDAEGLRDAELDADGLMDADGDCEAEGDSDSEAGPKLDVTQPKKRTSEGPVTENKVATPTAPAWAWPVRVIVLTACIDQLESVTGWLSRLACIIYFLPFY